MNFLRIIKAHKLASAVIGGVVVASGVAGATFAVINAQEPVQEQQVAQIVDEVPKTEENTKQTDSENEEESTNTKTDATATQQTIPTVQTPNQPSSTTQPTQQAQPATDNHEQKKQECITTSGQKHTDISRKAAYFSSLPPEEQAQYSGSSYQYTKKLISDLEIWRVSSGCSDYVDRAFPPYWYND